MVTIFRHRFDELHPVVFVFTHEGAAASCIQKDIYLAGLTRHKIFALIHG